MALYVKFLDIPVLTIDSKTPYDQDMLGMIIENQHYFDLDVNYVVPRNDSGYLEDWARDIGRIIKYLDDNKISWFSRPVPFVVDYEAGIFIIMDEWVKVVLVHINGEIEEDYFPLKRNKKLH
jgi:hypothetical protein